ncbi:MAG: HEAT repeat domain-containing protein [Coriobacteriia bacterium]|nr:HEAT repeat domain-containing protein [Coriobacteriia bacterium]
MFGPPDIKKLAARGKVDALVKALTHSDAKIRSEAARALGELRDPRAVEPLVAASRDDDRNVRHSAVSSLGAIGDPAAIPTLLVLLREGSERASWALAAIGEPAVGPLLEVLAAEYERHVGLAIRALGKIGDARAAAPIAAYLGGPATETRYATEALVAIGEASVTHVVPLLRSRGPSQRWAAVSALQALKWGPASDTERAAFVLAGGDLGEIRALDPASAAPLLAEATRWGWATDVHRAAAVARLVLRSAAVDDTARAWAADRLGEYARACDKDFRRITARPSPDDPRQRVHVREKYGEVGDLLWQAASYEHRSSGDGSGGHFHGYDTADGAAALKRLCAIDTPVTSNMLHLLTELPDVGVVKRDWEVEYDADHLSGGDARGEQLSFEVRREMARRELARRGNPEYDLSAYASDEGWTTEGAP